MPSHRRKTRIPFFEIVMLLLGLLYIAPVLIALFNSFKTNTQIIMSPLSLPPALNFDSYVYLFQNMNFATLMVNTLLLCASVIGTLVVIAPMAAYSLMRRQMRTAKFLRLFLLAGLIIPFQVIMIPLLQEFKFLGIQSTYFALWLTHIAGGIPLAVFIYSGFMSTIPKELEEAAAMDGCSPLRIFWKIVYPLLMPCTITIVIFWGLWIWNDFMAAFILVGPKAQLVFVQLWHMINDQYMKRWDYVFAGVTLLSVPVTILYVIMQRHFIKGLTAGAVK